MGAHLRRRSRWYMYVTDQQDPVTEAGDDQDTEAAETSEKLTDDQAGVEADEVGDVESGKEQGATTALKAKRARKPNRRVFGPEWV